jgi:molecular chaperone DnaK
MAPPVAEPSTLWIQWRGQDPTSWIQVDVRSVSVRAAFALLDEPPEPGTQGLFEARAPDGKVLRRGVCRVVFVREGVGAGLELRRSVSSAGSHSSPPPAYEPVPPSSHFRRPKSDEASRASTPKPRERDTFRPPEKAPARADAVGAVPDRPRGPDVPEPQAPEPRAPLEPDVPTAAELPGLDVGDLDLDLGPASGFGSAPPDGLELDLHGSPEANGAPEPIELDEDPWDPPPSEPEITGRPGTAPAVSESDLGIDLDVDLDLTPPSRPRPPRAVDESAAGSGDPSPGLPLSPSDEPPTSDRVRRPPPTLDDLPPDPGLPSLDEYPLPDADLPEPDAPESLQPAPLFENYERAVSESQRPPGLDEGRVSEPPPGEPTDEQAVQIETRTHGRGTTEGFAIGIDLGTSNTCASIVQNGSARVIPTRYGTHTVPSVYARVGHRVLVGEPAVKRMVLDPGETIYGSKRLIGRAYTESVAFDYQPYFAYRLAETRDHRFGAAIDGEVVSFEEVATALLEEVRDVASRHLGGPIDRAVITVPAYFTEVQREAVRRAARAARIMVDQLVPEPTAAAVAFGHRSARKGNFVVFDLGGGTFDISVMTAKDGDFEVLAIGGDPFLGGIDVDDMIANYLLEELHREIRERIEPTPQQLARLREVAEECKRGLSVQETFAIFLKHFTTVDGRPVDLKATVSRRTLEQIAEPFVQRLLEITRETVAAAGLEPDDVHELLLVGGMSRMPLVHDHVEALFHRRSDRKINPDEAVALGAALLASRIREVHLIDVLPLSIGIAGEGRRFLRLVPRNTSLPTTKSFVVRTERDLQTRYELPLYQGERRDATRNEYLGTLVIEGLAPRDAGRTIDVELQLDDQAVLSVVARDGVTGSPLQVCLSRDVSATEAQESHDEYSGAQESDDERLASPLGRFFRKVRGLFG